MKYLLMIFSPNCPFCDQNLETWLSISSELNDRYGVEVMFVSTFSDTSWISKYEQYAKIMNLYSSENSEKLARILKLTGIPSTILVTAKGEVLFTETGVLSEMQTRELLTIAKNEMPLNK